MRWHCLFLAMTFLSLCRPEGQIISLTLLFLLALRLWIDRKLFISVIYPFWSILTFLLFAFALIFPSWYFSTTTGYSGTNGLRAKSLLLHPIMTDTEKREAAVQNMQEMIKFLSGDPSTTTRMAEFILPGMFLFFLLGIIGLLLQRNRQGFWWALMFSIPLLIMLAAVATLEVWSLHSYRYLLPLVPLFILIGLVGIETAFRFWQVNGRLAIQTAFVIALILFITHLPVWVQRYARQCTTIHEKQSRAAWWINRQLPAAHPIAINDAGALAYYSEREIYDLVGLVSNTAPSPIAWAKALYEHLQNLPIRTAPAMRHLPLV